MTFWVLLGLTAWGVLVWRADSILEWKRKESLKKDVQEDWFS
jgi:hypothetical protein